MDSIRYLELKRVDFNTTIALSQIFTNLKSLKLQDCRLAGDEHPSTFIVDIGESSLERLEIENKNKDFFYGAGPDSDDSTRTRFTDDHILPNRKIIIQFYITSNQLYQRYQYNERQKSAVSLSISQFKKAKSTATPRSEPFVCISIKIRSLDYFKLSTQYERVNIQLSTPQ